MERERNGDKEEKEEERNSAWFKRCYSWFVLKIDRFKKNKIYSKQDIGHSILFNLY